MNISDNSDLTDLDTTISLDVLLQAAVDFHNTGNLEKAEAYYRFLVLQIDEGKEVADNLGCFDNPLEVKYDTEGFCHFL